MGDIPPQMMADPQIIAKLSMRKLGSSSVLI